MSVLQTIKDLKIPYPTEGVIRTAQLDDPVSPENSVQLAVNMNFDRVGALQTRLGVTSYADDIVEQINNFGTLRNAIIPPGYEFLAQLGGTSEVSAVEFQDPAAVKVSDTRVAIFWTGVDNDGFCQLFEIDQDTGEITPLGSATEFDTAQAINNTAILVSSSIVMNIWRGTGNDGFVRCFQVSGTSLVPMAAALEFDASNGSNFAVAQIDSTHFICFYTSVDDDGVATVFQVDTGTGAVTEPGSPLTFDSGINFYNACVAVGDGTHFINFWGPNGEAQCFEVNTGTWAITALGTPLTFGTTVSHTHAFSLGDGEHFLGVFQESGDHVAQAFLLNTGTFAMTTIGTPVDISVFGNDLAVAKLDNYNYVAFYSRNVGDGFVQMFNIDQTTFNATLTGDALSGYDFANQNFTTAINLSSTRVMVVWGIVDWVSGKAAMFESFGDVVEGRWLYAGHGDEVSNTPAPGGAWVSRRSGLATVSKPRFSQYLNYIWMVNGNEQIGGDSVATSNGGAFGDDLVPENFPKGDFINAGFEGRIWIANKTLGIIYYSDIVQFLPPNSYTITYDQEVNFITTISPQTGQTITALFRVPRALLVFTEDTITRIYGATSIDSYPAYDVGTYSQESIIQTKTGIFFHHSSGFYQFDYGSQPVEISRRIIDFVKAIPRAYYDDITGVWDGFDNVEWSVGPVTVEGVTFSNCVLRYTISTQVWTVYDYVGNTITAMIYFDDGVEIAHIMGTSLGKVGAMDSGFTDFGQGFYFEYIDRWRAYSEMYYQQKIASGFNVHSENAAGANLLYQIQKSGPNVWEQLGTIDERNNSKMPNADTVPFDVMRLRIAGTTKGAQVVIHGIEIMDLTILGQEQN